MNFNIIEIYFTELMHKDKLTKFDHIFLFLTLYISRIYNLVLNLRKILYGMKIFKTRKLPCKVISVGNLTLGGTGKTPVVESIANTLKENSIDIAILSRGYKAKRREKIQMINGSNMEILNTKEYGDEPVMLAGNLRDVPVVIGSDRYSSALFILKKRKVKAVLLDDGFQNLSVRKDIDILLIDCANPWGNGNLFPHGILREPLREISRADIVLLTNVYESGGHEIKKLMSEVKILSGKKNIFTSFYEPMNLYNHSEYSVFPLSSIKNRKVMCFSGIASPSYFEKLIEKNGACIVRSMHFPDHYEYRIEELKEIEESAKSSGCDLMLTTQKDSVKFTDYYPERIPLWIMKVRIVINEKKEWEDQILKIFQD